eukprot:1145526-Pelagomonas_calceolata.AAC.9
MRVYAIQLNVKQLGFAQKLKQELPALARLVKSKNCQNVKTVITSKNAFPNSPLSQRHQHRPAYMFDKSVECDIPASTGGRRLSRFISEILQTKPDITL